MNFARIISSGLFVGDIPFAPGTFGSVLGVVLAYCLNLGLSILGLDTNVNLAINIFVIMLLYFAGVWSIKKIQQIWKHDDKRIVIDEIVGVWIVLLVTPFEIKYYIIALAIFRFFDIIKPLGIKKIDNLGTDISVMLDDVLAGFYSIIAMFLIVNYT